MPFVLDRIKLDEESWLWLRFGSQLGNPVCSKGEEMTFFLWSPHTYPDSCFKAESYGDDWSCMMLWEINGEEEVFCMLIGITFLLPNCIKFQIYYRKEFGLPLCSPQRYYLSIVNQLFWVPMIVLFFFLPSKMKWIKLIYSDLFAATELLPLPRAEASAV